MKKLSKKETIDLEKLEADKAEAYARKQRRQYRNRFGRFVPALVGITKYVVVARVLLAIF